MGIRRGRNGLDHLRLRTLWADAAQWRDAGRENLSQVSDIRGDDIGPYRPWLGRRTQLFLLPRRRVWIWLWLRHPYRSWQRGAAAARLARGDQMGRRYRRLPCGRPRPGYVFWSDAEFSLRAHARSGDAEEDHLRRVRKVIEPIGEPVLRGAGIDAAGTG